MRFVLEYTERMCIMAYFNEFPHTRNYDQDLGWLISKMKKLLENYTGTLNTIEEVQDLTNYLKNELNKIISGEYDGIYQDNLQKYLSDHLPEIIASIVKFVFFGISESGYFVAYIPESWEEIIFKTTGLDISISGFDYGRLVLQYDIEGVV